MFPRDRSANLGLLAAATIAWFLVLLLFLTRSPAGDVPIQLLGAGLLGFAIGVTAAPLLWLAAFTLSGGIAYRGSWWRAGRRAAWLAVIVTLFVLLRAQGAFSLPVALFIVAMALIVESSLSLRRGDHR